MSPKSGNRFWDNVTRKKISKARRDSRDSPRFTLSFWRMPLPQNDFTGLPDMSDAAFIPSRPLSPITFSGVRQKKPD